MNSSHRNRARRLIGNQHELLNCCFLIAFEADFIKHVLRLTVVWWSLWRRFPEGKMTGSDLWRYTDMCEWRCLHLRLGNTNQWPTLRRRLKRWLQTRTCCCMWLKNSRLDGHSGLSCSTFTCSSWLLVALTTTWSIQLVFVPDMYVCPICCVNSKNPTFASYCICRRQSDRRCR